MAMLNQQTSTLSLFGGASLQAMSHVKRDERGTLSVLVNVKDQTLLFPTINP